MHKNKFLIHKSYLNLLNLNFSRINTMPFNKYLFKTFYLTKYKYKFLLSIYIKTYNFKTALFLNILVQFFNVFYAKCCFKYLNKNIAYLLFSFTKYIFYIYNSAYVETDVCYIY